MMKNPDCYQVIGDKDLGVWHKHTTGFDISLFSNEDYVYHTLAAKASGELCLKYIFAFGAFARMPLLQRFDNFTFFHLNLFYTFFWLKLCVEYIFFFCSIFLKIIITFMRNEYFTDTLKYTKEKGNPSGRGLQNGPRAHQNVI